MVNPLSEVRSKKAFNSHVHAIDGDLGKLKDMYFDDATWAIRYLIIDTGKWLPGRRVLISPHDLAPDALAGKTIRVNLSKEQIRNSPNINADKPVSRQQEQMLGAYYGWPPVPPMPLVGGGMMAGGYTYTRAHYAHIGALPADTEERDDYDPHLRSMREVIGYRVELSEGEIGEVEDFLVNLNGSRVVSIISKANPDRELFLPIEEVQRISWENRSVRMRIGTL
jgi:hypothetical protein